MPNLQAMRVAEYTVIIEGTGETSYRIVPLETQLLETQFIPRIGDLLVASPDGEPVPALNDDEEQVLLELELVEVVSVVVDVFEQLVIIMVEDPEADEEPDLDIPEERPIPQKYNPPRLENAHKERNDERPTPRTLTPRSDERTPTKRIGSAQRKDPNARPTDSRNSSGPRTNDRRSDGPRTDGPRNDRPPRTGGGSGGPRTSDSRNSGGPRTGGGGNSRGPNSRPGSKPGGRPPGGGPKGKKRG